MNHLKPANQGEARRSRSNHRRIEDLIAASVDFDLTQDERAEVGEHLISCPACQAVSAGYWRDADALRTLAFVAPRPSSGLSLGPRERWAELTGNLDDPAAATCRWSGVGEPIAIAMVVPTCRARVRRDVRC